MTEQQPTTGATPERIEAAAFRMHDTRTQPGKLPHGDWPCAQCCGQADSWADCFVPPDHRIVPATRVLDDADVSALARLKEITAYASAVLILEGDFGRRTTETAHLIDLLDAITLPHDWERIDRILAADATRTEGTP